MGRCLLCDDSQSWAEKRLGMTTTTLGTRRSGSSRPGAPKQNDLGKPMKKGLVLVTTFIAAGCLLLFFLWETRIPDDSSIVVFFGRPGDLVQYVASNWQALATASIFSLLTALSALG